MHSNNLLVLLKKSIIIKYILTLLFLLITAGNRHNPLRATAHRLETAGLKDITALINITILSLNMVTMLARHVLTYLIQ